MSPKQQFFDPIIETSLPTSDQDPGLQLEAIMIPQPGIFLPLEGAISYLLAAADQWDRDQNPSGALALRAVAEAWSQALAPTTEPPPANDDATTSPEEIPAEGLIVAVQDAYRVEVYPDNPAAERPRWHARSVDTNGHILYVTGGSFDQDYVLKDAESRWPGVAIQMIADAYVDSVWEEQAPDSVRGVLTHRRRPSPNRMFGQV